MPYSFLGGEVTFAAAPPWSLSSTTPDRTSTTLGGATRPSEVSSPCCGTGYRGRNPSARADQDCDAGPVPADAAALVRSIRSNPDLEASTPVAARVGGIDAVQMDVVALRQPEVGERLSMVLDGVWAGEDRMRLYLLDLPEGMSARILAIAIVAQESEFERVVNAAEPVLDSFEFHTP